MKKNAVLIVGVLVVITIAFVNAKKMNPATLGEGYKVGSDVADFSLKNIDGQMVSMADYKEAKGYIVVFTCNTCPYAKMYEQRIEALNQMYASKGFPVLAINSNDVTKQPDDSFEKMQNRANEKSYSFPYLYDESQAIATRFGATRTPHVFVVSKNSDKLKVAYIGAIDNNPKDAAAADVKYVEDAINSLLAGDAVETDFTKAIGCTIKWKEA